MKKISSMRDVPDFAISGDSKAAIRDGIRIADVLNTAFFVYRIEIRGCELLSIAAYKKLY
ncbi:MAG: hypothetical protein ACYS3S_24760 [Planctomycetota bacterium]|jgi:hypothetical protein